MERSIFSSSPSVLSIIFSVILAIRTSNGMYRNIRFPQKHFHSSELAYSWFVGTYFVVIVFSVWYAHLLRCGDIHRHTGSDPASDHTDSLNLSSNDFFPKA